MIRSFQFSPGGYPQIGFLFFLATSTRPTICTPIVIRCKGIWQYVDSSSSEGKLESNAW